MVHHPHNDTCWYVHPLMRQTYTPYKLNTKAYIILYKIFHCSYRVTRDVARWFVVSVYIFSLGQLLIFNQVLNCFWLRTLLDLSSLPSLVIHWKREQLNISPYNDKIATSSKRFWGHSPLFSYCLVPVQYQRIYILYTGRNLLVLPKWTNTSLYNH